mmetsp:Transcript_63331/g.169324  ORF Transcript_63331/g.169324 Transcript_63331/m.169324 type:complete len:321 (-) Transcript_63331:84-1046(-)
MQKWLLLASLANVAAFIPSLEANDLHHNGTRRARKACTPQIVSGMTYCTMLNGMSIDSSHYFVAQAADLEVQIRWRANFTELSHNWTSFAHAFCLSSVAYSYCTSGFRTTKKPCNTRSEYFFADYLFLEGDSFFANSDCASNTATVPSPPSTALSPGTSCSPQFLPHLQSCNGLFGIPLTEAGIAQAKARDAVMSDLLPEFFAEILIVDVRMSPACASAFKDFSCLASVAAHHCINNTWVLQPICLSVCARFVSACYGEGQLLFELFCPLEPPFGDSFPSPPDCANVNASTSSASHLASAGLAWAAAALVAAAMRVGPHA